MYPEYLKITDMSGGNIRFPTITPLFDAAPYSDRFEHWINENGKLGAMEASIAKKITANINHISFAKFLEQLKKMIADFNNKCSKPYVLWIAQSASGKLDEGCSEPWVAGLSFEFAGLRMPEAIVTTPTLPFYLSENPHIESVLVLDDALYSGTHLIQELRAVIYDLANTELFIGIPFMSNIINDIIKDSEPNFQIKMHLLDYIQLPRIVELLTEEELEYIREKHLVTVSVKKTLTYFDHKLPDEFSLPSILSTGEYLRDTTDCLKIIEHIKQGTSFPEQGITQIHDPAEWGRRYIHFQNTHYNPLIPSIITPYKLHTAEEQTKLGMALEKGTIGSFNAMQLPKDRIGDNVSALLTNSGITFDSPVNPVTDAVMPTQEMKSVKKHEHEQVNSQGDLDLYFDDLLNAIQRQNWKFGYCLGFFTGFGGQSVTIFDQRIKVPEHAAQIVNAINEYKTNRLSGKGALKPEEVYQKIGRIIHHAITNPKYSRAQETMQFYDSEALKLTLRTVTV